MKVIAGGKRAANPYAAIAEPYLQQFHQKMIKQRGGTVIECAFNKFSAAERKAIFVLGNAKAESWPGKMAKLGQEQIAFKYDQFTAQEKLTLISGMKSLKELSDRIPYSRPGEEAAERFAKEDAAKRKAQGNNNEKQEGVPISSVTDVSELKDDFQSISGF
ncbi:MAG: hypothetical protein E6556_01875 [Pantoea sp.]|nr:hypothetical protein [Pantoea sp.]